MKADGKILIDKPVTYGTDTEYTLNFICDSMVPKGGRIEIYIPEPFEIENSAVTSSGTCGDKNTCTMQVVDDDNDGDRRLLADEELERQKRTVLWTITKQIPAKTPIQFKLKGVRNPRTFATTGNFFIRTRDSNLISEIDSGFD